MFRIGPFCTLTNSSKKFEVETFSCRFIDQSYKENSNRVKKTKKSYFFSTLADLQQKI